MPMTRGQRPTQHQRGNHQGQRGRATNGENEIGASTCSPHDVPRPGRSGAGSLYGVTLPCDGSAAAVCDDVDAG